MPCLTDRRKRQRKRKKMRQRQWKKRRKDDDQMRMTCSTGRECLVQPTMSTLYRHFANKRKLRKRSAKENASASR